MLDTIKKLTPVSGNTPFARKTQCNVNRFVQGCESCSKRSLVINHVCSQCLSRCMQTHDVRRGDDMCSCVCGLVQLSPSCLFAWLAHVNRMHLRFWFTSHGSPGISTRCGNDASHFTGNRFQFVMSICADITIVTIGTDTTSVATGVLQ